jgi:hypothetical protein
MMRYALFLLFLSISVRADQLTIPNALSNNTVADADAVDTNFDALVTESNENDTRIGALEGNVRVDAVGVNLAVGNGLQVLAPDAGDQESASFNTAIGIGALIVNTTGYLNTAVGINTLYSNVEGAFNSAFGNGALYYNDTGIYNTAIGSRAAYNGTSAGYSVAVGREALLANITGSRNTAIGYKADVSSGSLSNATAIGNEALVNANNKIQLGNTSVDSVATSGKLTTGAVTYPNTMGPVGTVLGVDINGDLTWITGAGIIASFPQEFEGQLASLQQQFQSQQEELLAIVQRQQEQIAQLQKLVEHQFVMN